MSKWRGLHVLGAVCRMLHAFMPFPTEVTEEPWHRLPRERDFLVRQAVRAAPAYP
jgi:valyl-tRNA synthetase